MASGASTQTSGRTQLTPAGQRILTAASDLFYRDGIHAVGVESIASAAGVTKKTLYDCFGSKDYLVAAYLRARERRWRAWLTDFVDRHAESGRSRILATFDALAVWTQRENPRGCAFVNALAELPSPEHPGRVAVLEQKRWMANYLNDLATTADHPQPAELAATLLLLHEGVSVTSASGALNAATEHAKRTAATLVDRTE